MTPPLLIHPLAEVREQLSQVVSEFRAEGATAQPVVFGAHRKAEAVLLSYQAYREGYEAFQSLRRECDELLEQLSRYRAFAAALASVRAEGLEPPPDLIAQGERLVAGELTVDEAYEEALRRYRRQ
ncbi:hypothetical protein NRB56_64920 [Nocardia sp. RB56]|uniref:Antitoxin VbhA domain-containing protein n=1 Tax=Nocardia aurantia TaxID=2585199 RepID=A0A7K0DZA2_9NOCA|nr:hypothetical protein [Nocardia aurantia]